MNKFSISNFNRGNDKSAFFEFLLQAHQHTLLEASMPWIPPVRLEVVTGGGDSSIMYNQMTARRVCGKFLTETIPILGFLQHTRDKNQRNAESTAVVATEQKLHHHPTLCHMTSISAIPASQLTDSSQFTRSLVSTIIKMDIPVPCHQNISTWLIISICIKGVMRTRPCSWRMNSIQRMVSLPR